MKSGGREEIIGCNPAFSWEMGKITLFNESSQVLRLCEIQVKYHKGNLSFRGTNEVSILIMEEL